MKSYQDLIVWQKSISLSLKIYEISNKFPKDEIFGITSQMRRASTSIPSNIAEGYGRFYTKDYSRFLQISRGSLYELQTQLEIVKGLKYITDKEYIDIFNKSIEIGKMLVCLIKKIDSHIADA